MGRITLLLILILTMAGCGGDSANNGNEKVEHSFGIMPGTSAVGVLGGETCKKFCQGLRAAGIEGAVTTQNTDLTARAALISLCDTVIILVDVTKGPKPINREDVILSRQFALGPVLIGFSQTTHFMDRDSLRNQQWEMRDLLNEYDLPGDRIFIVHDSPDAPTGIESGFPKAARVISNIKPPAKSGRTQLLSKSFEAWIYVLDYNETYKAGMAEPIRSGKYWMIFGHMAVKAKLRIGSPIQPGKINIAKVKLPKKMIIPKKLRFVISSPDHIIATGTVKKQ